MEEVDEIRAGGEVNGLVSPRAPAVCSVRGRKGKSKETLTQKWHHFHISSCVSSTVKTQVSTFISS